MIAHGEVGKRQTSPDLLVGEPFGEQTENVALAFGQPGPGPIAARLGTIRRHACVADDHGSFRKKRSQRSEKGRRVLGAHRHENHAAARNGETPRKRRLRAG